MRLPCHEHLIKIIFLINGLINLFFKSESYFIMGEQNYLTHISYLADAFIQSDLQMRTIETNKRATCKHYDKSQSA